MTALAMLRKAERLMISPRRVGLVATRASHLGAIRLSNSTCQMELMVEAKRVGIFASGGEHIEFRVIRAERVHEPAEHRALHVGLGAFSTHASGMLQQVLTVPVTGRAFHRGTSMQT